jgi:YidC/Oxa1 family membrane protein insertase
LVATTNNNSVIVVDSALVDSTKALTYNKDGVFYGAMEGTDTSYTIANDVMRVKISSKGATIKQVRLSRFLSWDQRPLEMYYDESNHFELSFLTTRSLVKTSDLYFEPIEGIAPGDSVAKVAGDSMTVAFRAYARDAAGNNNGAIIFRYVFYKDTYRYSFYIDFEKSENFIPAGTNLMTLNWNADLERNEKSIDNERLSSTVYYCDSDEEVDYLSERKDDEENLKYSLKWVSFKQQFFSTTLIANTKFTSGDIKSYTRELNDTNYLKTMSASLSLDFVQGQDSSISFSYYTGPNKYKTLRAYGLGMERQIPLGWSFAPLAWINRFAVIPVFNWLESYNLNYGIIILLLTIMLKLVLFPIAMRTYKSSAKMRILKPEVDAIGKKFPKKEDSMKKQQATMELYKKAGASPMSGCVPMLLQMPILIALFRFFPASIELRQQSFLWASDLSTYDSVLNLGFTIPFYGDHVSLFALLMAISTLIYTRLNDKMMGSSASMPGMKTMMYLMPIMFLGFFNSYASGLSYYYLLANLMTFAQIFAIRYFTDEDALRAKIEANKKKPVKKSNWAKRLEEANKARSAQRK